MLDDVISTGLQAILAEVFESVDKDQLNVSLVGDIFKESHLELTDLRFKKSLLKDLNFPVEVKEGLVGKLVIQGLSGLMTGDPVVITVSEVLVLLAPGDCLSDPEAGLAARRLVTTLREMFANRYSEEFLEEALRVKMEDRRSLQEQNKLNRKLMRHICRKLLASLSITLQTVHVRFELPAGGLGSNKPVKNSAGVGGGGACDAIGVMLPTLSIRTCGADHQAFTKFANYTPLDRVASKTGGAGGPSLSSSSSGNRAGAGGEKKNFTVVRKRTTLSSLQVYCDYGVDSYVTDIGAAVATARDQATNPRSGGGGGVGASSSAAAAVGTNSGAVAAARALRSVFLKKWKSERHALLFKPLGVEIGAELHQWDRPRGKPVVPFYRVNRLNVSLGELQAVVDAEQGRVLGTVVREVVNLIRRSRFNRFVPQAFLPLRNLPPPKVRLPKAPKDGAPGGILPSVECWSWSAEIGLHGDQAPDGLDIRRKPRSASEAVLRGGFRKEGGAWARAMWRFAGACVRHDLRTSSTRRLPASLPSWDGSTVVPGREASRVPSDPSRNGVSRNGDATRTEPKGAKESWRLRYMGLYARTLSPREAKSLGSTRTPDVRRLGVPRGREPLSLEEMWELARVESYGPGDEVVFLRTAAKVSSHYEWVRNRRLRSATKGSAAMALWTPEDDARILADLDKLRIRRAAAKLAAKEAGAGAEGEESDEEDEEITRLEFFARDGQSLTQAATSSNPFSDDEDEDDEEEEEEEEEDAERADDAKAAGATGAAGDANGLPGMSIDTANKSGSSRSIAGSGRPSLGDVMAKASSAAGRPPPPSVVVVRTGGGGKKRGGVATELWAKLFSVPRVIIEVASIGIELRTCISGGSRRPLVALSANGVCGTVEGDEVKRMLWWEFRVGKVVLRDLCSSWGAGGASSASAVPVAKTLLSGFASGTEGREWSCAGDAMGPAARSFFIVRVVHDPNRFTCSLFPGSAASLAELRAHVVVGTITGKIPPQVLKVFNAAARDVLVGKAKADASGHPAASSSVGLKGANDSARQLRVAVTAIHEAILAPVTVSFKSKKKRGPGGATKMLSLLKGAIARSSGAKPSTPNPGKTGKSDELVDSKELYKMVAGMLPGDFELRAHSSEVILQVESRAEDLLEAGRVGFEAIGEGDAAARMQGSHVASDEIQLEVNFAPAKMDLSRSSHPSPELVLDTGAMRSKIRAPDKAVEAVTTALLSSAQQTKAVIALLSHDMREKNSQ